MNHLLLPFVAVALAATLSAHAHADITQGDIDTYSGAVCESIDNYPAPRGVRAVVNGLARVAEIPKPDAAQIVVQSVIGACPRHLGLLDRVLTSLVGRQGL